MAFNTLHLHSTFQLRGQVLPPRWALPAFTCGNGGTEWLCDLPKVTESDS